ncbi:MAG: DoxX family protein [Planctomycetaceae bacterium]
MAGPLYAAKFKNAEGKDESFEEHLKGEAVQYERLIDRFEAMRADAKLDYNWTHLDYEKTKLMEQKAKALGPIKALDAELHNAALKYVTLDQLSRGPVAPDPEPVHTKDLLVMTGLVCLGFCLISGFLTRLCAFLGAIMIFSFYLVMPPLPGIPHAPGPDHSLFVDKNLIEVFALLVLAAFPTGRWFGIDAALFGWWERRKVKSTTPKPAKEASSTEPAAATS